ncbi:alpha-2-macroglobulin [Marinibaculum pumilum]|uniref:Alpha-2-macroglobulin n=1 Tax=Marinibaculum pumilum TaxID=1766165 RepID=A0ABV7LA58_9PROT
MSAIALRTAALLSLLLAAVLLSAPPPAMAQAAFAPPAGLADRAARLQDTILDGVAAAPQVTRDALAASRDSAADAANWNRAIAFQKQIVQRDRLRGSGRDGAAFVKLAELYGNAGNGGEAAAAAWLAVEAADRSGDGAARAAAYGALSDALAVERDWSHAAAALRAAQAAAGDPKLREDRLDWLEAQYLMRVEQVQVLADQSIPEACIRFTRPLAQPLPLPAQDYLRLEDGGPVSVSAGPAGLCIGGLQHGESYRAVVRKGLPQADGPALAADEDVAFTVDHRPAAVSFPTGPYVLPTARAPAVDLRSVNVSKVALRLMRIADRNLVNRLREGLHNPLYGGQVDELAAESGEQVWRGTMELADPPDEEQRTAVPLAEMMPAPQPGIYVLLAANADDPEQLEWSWTDWAAQWIVLSDIGLASYQGSDGLHVVARSLRSAEPMPGVELRLVSRNNQVLDRVATDADGYALIAPGLLRGSGGNRPAALYAAAAAEGDFTFLDLTGPALELAERGVAGRPAPGPVDAYLYSDRGVYRPGETLPVNLLVRDRDGLALPGMPVVLKLTQPDGREAARQTAVSGSLGALRADFPLAQASQTGQWTVTAHADPAADPVGSLQVTVEDFVPQRIALTLDSAAAAIRAGETVTVKATGEYLYGAPAADLPVKGTLTLQADPAPFPGLPGFRFGLVQDPYSPERRSLPEVRTDAAGHAELPLLLDSLPDAAQPLQARIAVSLFGEGGRPVSRSLTLPVRAERPSIGLKPGFADGQVAEGQAAGFEVALVDGAGEPVAGRDLEVSWIAEDVDYFWYWEDGRLRFRETVRDRVVESSALSVGGDGRATVSQRLPWGRYRLEVADRGAGAASSLRFQVGWGVTPSLPDTPDALELSLAPRDAGTGPVEAFVKAPFAGVVEVMVVNDGLRYRRTLPLPASGAHVSIPVQADWGVGAYLLATAYRPEAGGDDRTARGPSRAMGAAWFPIGTASRRLGVSLDPPEVARPGTEVTVPLQVTAAAGTALPQEMRLAVAAVDEGVLQLTDFTSPDPADHFFGQRRLAMDVHDLYGRLIAPATGMRGNPRSGGDGGGNLDGVSVQTVKVVHLYEGPVTPGPEGRAQVTLALPDGFNGRLRLMAVAWSRAAVGAGSAALTVRNPVVSSLILPQFLAPGDEAEALLSLDNVEGGDGTYTATVTAEGAVAVLDGGQLEQRIAAGGRVRHRVTLSGTSVGTGRLALRLTSPGGIDIAQDWEIAVRPAQPWQSERRSLQLAAGESFTSTTAAEAGMIAGTARIDLSISPVPDVDVPGLLAALRDYPYRCLEQSVSTAYPELFARSLAANWTGVAAEPVAADAAVQAAIRSSIARQKPDGSFGLWNQSGPAEPWLTIYAMDFLSRARAAGHAVPEPVTAQGADWMKNALRYPPEGLTPDGRAYALYVLSRMPAMDASGLRYWAESLSGQVTTPLGLAFLGAARRAAGQPLEDAPALVLAAAEAGTEPRAADWRDYGSSLRDAAATLAVLAEAEVSADRLTPLLNAVSGAAASRDHLSTQEQAWLLRAAHAVADAGGRAEAMRLEVAGRLLEPVRTAVTEHLQGGDPAVTVRNAGAAAVWAYETVRGVPAASLPPAEQGFRISRRYFTLEGREVTLDRVRQNDRFVALVEGAARDGGSHQALVVDLLPAGLEIESQATGGTTALSALPFLPVLTEPLFEGVRSDRYLAAIDLEGEGARFAFAYLVRAVTPGRYVHPAPFVEDMYQPYLFARGAIGELTVARP